MDKKKLTAGFDKLVAALPAASKDALRAAVKMASERLAKADNSYLGPNPHLATEIADRLSALIDQFDALKPWQQQLVSGAVYYFNLADDEIPDLKPLVGLDDDAEIVNYVLRRLGRESEVIVLDS